MRGDEFKKLALEATYKPSDTSSAGKHIDSTMHGDAVTDDLTSRWTGTAELHTCYANTASGLGQSVTLVRPFCMYFQ